MNWLALSILSGVFAALNGLFAKLTTTALTKGIAEAVGRVFGVDSGWIVEGGVRGVFFALNLVFNAVMWGLFTAALARGSSATKVSVINTSSNFMITALLGSLVFAEKLPGLWWLGAGLLVSGNVIIGRRDEEEKKVGLGGEAGYLPVSQAAEGEEEEEEGQGQQVRLDSVGRGSGSGSENYALGDS
ncbi:hypothetical protein DFH27DRAFT_523662 [Peziza echinospora]|nr:hypothetical protein DFH27DRAFT_523662 [Peziza echinospora]